MVNVALVTGSRVSALVNQDRNGWFSHATGVTFSSCACNCVTKCSARTGLARHSAMTKGSFPSAAKISRNTLRLFGVTGHALHLGLQLLSNNRPLPVVLQRPRVVQIFCHFLLDLRLRHHGVERWLGIRALPAAAGPDAMTPVNLFDSPLIRDTLGEAQASVLMCIRAEGGMILRSRNLQMIIRQIDRRTERDNRT